jgi:catechol-2,3-dioxygenase
MDLHIALGVDPDAFDSMLRKARNEGVEVRGPVDHGFCRSIHMRDPNGYVVELTAGTGVQQEIMEPHEALARWQAAKPGQPAAA